jgi:hypothetical protein
MFRTPLIDLLSELVRAALKGHTYEYPIPKEMTH